MVIMAMAMATNSKALREFDSILEQYRKPNLFIPSVLPQENEIEMTVSNVDPENDVLYVQFIGTPLAVKLEGRIIKEIHPDFLQSDYIKADDELSIDTCDIIKWLYQKVLSAGNKSTVLGEQVKEDIFNAILSATDTDYFPISKMIKVHCAKATGNKYRIFMTCEGLLLKEECTMDGRYITEVKVRSSDISTEEHYTTYKTDFHIKGSTRQILLGWALKNTNTLNHARQRVAK